MAFSCGDGYAHRWACHLMMMMMIVTVAVSVAVREIFSVKNGVTLKTKLGVVQGH